jgi:hypothetical protein
MKHAPSLDERLRQALTPDLVARAAATTPETVATWPAAHRAAAEQAVLARVKAALRTHSRLMLDLGARYHLPPTLELGRAIEAGWLPASAASALFALWTSTEGQLALEVFERANAFATIAAGLALVERARDANLASQADRAARAAVPAGRGADRDTPAVNRGR